MLLLYITENNLVNYRLIDLRGRVIEKNNLGALKSGTHQITLNLKNATAIYILQFHIGVNVVSHKILTTKF